MRRLRLRNRLLVFGILFGLGITAVSAQTFNRFNFSVGGGYGHALGDVGKLTGASFNGVAGGGWNFSRALGVKAEYMYYNLSFQDSVKAQQSVPDATGHVHGATLNFFYNVPVQGKVGVYAIGGAGWYQRSVETRAENLPGGAVCQPAWQLWGIVCKNGLTDGAQTLASNTVSGGGYNFGGGLTYRLSKETKLYVEGRYHHANTSDRRTTLFPVTVGFRW